MVIADIGIDPGGRHTGIVGRLGSRVLSTVLVVREAEDMRPYIHEVLAQIAIARSYAIEVTRTQYPMPRVAVEDVNAPSPHMGMISVGGLLGTAQVLGAVIGEYVREVIVVPPDGNGSAPLRVYPSELVGPREKSGTGPKRHLRSAFDVAGKAAAFEKYDKVKR